jgi:Nucleotide modification associated domain 2
MGGVMGNLYTYVVRFDAGLAPNPFGEYCTLAVCTPNHQGSRAVRGDWIAGVSDKSRGYQLIYVMEVEERIGMDKYFSDPRFSYKKPIPGGSPRQRCGDNFYSLGKDKQWIQHPNSSHVGEVYLAKDTKHPTVFVARRFWYLGRNAIDTPSEFLPMFGGRGARVNHPHELVARFRVWVTKNLRQGLNALPRDFSDDPSACSSGHSIVRENCGGC